MKNVSFDLKNKVNSIKDKIREIEEMFLVPVLQRNNEEELELTFNLLESLFNYFNIVASAVYKFN